MFKKYWNILEKKASPPNRLNRLIKVDFKKFRKKIELGEEPFVKKLTNSLYKGDVYLLKNAFEKKFLNEIKIKCHIYFKNKPSKFYKMLEGCPDFHRFIDIEKGKKYSFKGCKHAYYFYKWNKDPLNIFPEIYDKWRILKILMGLKMDEYENNTPKDGVVDRVQVVRYPSKFGFLEPHSDPYKFQRLFCSGYMSKKGKDYKGGGFYSLNKKNKIVDVEKNINIGDIGIGYATVIHGVAPVNRHKNPDLKDIQDGRWFLSMYTNQSDEVKTRHTGYSVAKKLNINNPELFPSV